MATEETLAAVKINIPDDADADGWDDAYIGTLLDAGLSITKTTLAFWAARVGKYANLVDISEAGSSRSLSQLFNQAQAMHQIWLDKSKLEDNPVPETRSRAAFHTLKRV